MTGHKARDESLPIGCATSFSAWFFSLFVSFLPVSILVGLYWLEVTGSD
jgi:hypothetical protein